MLFQHPSDFVKAIKYTNGSGEWISLEVLQDRLEFTGAFVKTCDLNKAIVDYFALLGIATDDEVGHLSYFIAQTYDRRLDDLLCSFAVESVSPQIFNEDVRGMLRESLLYDHSGMVLRLEVDVDNYIEIMVGKVYSEIFVIIDGEFMSTPVMQELIFELKCGPAVNMFALLGLGLFDMKTFLGYMSNFFMDDATPNMFKRIAEQIDFRSTFKATSVILDRDFQGWYYSEDFEVDKSLETRIMDFRRQKVSTVHQKIQSFLKAGYIT